jgi:hypothetical protein
MPSDEDRARQLTEATRKYLRGELNDKEYDAARRAHEVDYMAALTALVRFQRTAPRDAEPQEA